MASSGHVSHCLNAGGMGRQDFESETLVAHSLRGEGFDASEDGTGRGTPLVPVAFDTTQITSAGNYSAPKPGDPCHPLAAGAHPPTIAFSSKDHGADAEMDLSPTLRAGSHAASHANAGVPPAVAFGWQNSEHQGDSVSADVTPTPDKSKTPAVAQGWAVRRLTPEECEALQGFPRGFTDIPWRGKLWAPDGPRYKALGNSMAVPVVRWIMERMRASMGRENGWASRIIEELGL